jgi:hypothetical protein
VVGFHLDAMRQAEPSPARPDNRGSPRRALARDKLTISSAQSTSAGEHRPAGRDEQPTWKLCRCSPPETSARRGFTLGELCEPTTGLDERRGRSLGAAANVRAFDRGQHESGERTRAPAIGDADAVSDQRDPVAERDGDRGVESLDLVIEQAGGGRLREIGNEIAGAAESWRQVTRASGGQLAWPALLRRLDRLEPGYGD